MLRKKSSNKCKGKGNGRGRVKLCDRDCFNCSKRDSITKLYTKGYGREYLRNKLDLT